MEILFDIINESEYAVILSDREGVVIRVMCGSEMKDICSKINLREGADYRMESVGTNSINMAIELKKPVQITGCQHFRQIFQHYTSSSAPVLTESGGVLCVLSVLGKYEQENEHTLGMIHSITKGIESQHHINKINRNLKKRNNQLEKILSMVSDSIVYTENRKIIQVNGSMLKLIGKDESEVIGRNVYDTIVTQPSLAEFFADEKKANNGTLFLDEIGNMSLDMQIKLLRVLQEGVVFRIGGASPVSVDLRVIAATNADLEQEIRNGTFREDLYYRLNVFRIKIPPLRERRSDIPLLVNNLIKTSNNIDPSVKVDKSAMDVFTGYDWPGNVRQLHNAVERAIIMADEHVIYPESISGEISGSRDVQGAFTGGSFEASNETLEEMTGRYIKFCLDLNDGNISRTAKQLDVSRTTIYKYIS